jgi:phosphatidylserine/phosphatidylglycerophosphate/cardiolipin synthase-like enzyme
VICDCPELAKIFEAFLLNDNAQAQAAAKEAAQGAAAAAAAALAGKAGKAGAAGVAALEAPRAAPLPLPLLSPTEAQAPPSKTPKKFFQSKTISGRMKITPLLTPDSYRVPILNLIKSAKTQFYMQTQYIHTTDNEQSVDGKPTHMDLIAAVADLINQGVDVKLITSEYQTKPWIEKLQDAGVDAANHLRIQRNVHNKGIVVDSQVCVVSSQNWSGEGTGSNRDAGLIIYNADAAQYFEQIFLHDWVNLASHSAMA